ncbi:hypothetical protein FXV77_18395 [Sphingobacterium phlebotomi]|uniref:Uncharacterized protein n=1 Tax=Sphingobacterium phlebotomi TaxID=2605433 RepID=A0A5D4GX79_9SPHI|nr:hypothetical protein [Sphingobacterium phlebotomi]TYR33008.1 hypothetical protein FXV77_18395 [Sphingobacterium phlebotomi]
MEKNIPKQVEGKSLDCFKSVNLSSQEEATRFFERIRSKLLDVNRWNEITKALSATFTIIDASGRTMERPVQKDDYIRIDIPGPGLPSAKGYDWVQVEGIAETADAESARILLILRPCPDPTQELTDTAHFFKRLATSSFLVQQKGSHISLHYAGRNEIINTDNESMLDNLRNFMVGLGAKMGASFPQWKALVEGLGDVDSH